MKLMLSAEWVETYFTENSQPNEVTLARWLREGVVPARKIGGRWYIDVQAWEAGGDDLVARVLGGVS